MPGSVKYLFDADVLIRAKNDSHFFDVNPEFWGWLEEGNAKGAFFSVDKVRDEVCGGNKDIADPLREWATKPGMDSFFLLTKGCLSEWTKLAAWADGNGFKSGALEKFLNVRSGDAWLISYAMKHGGFTIVTHELSDPLSKRTIKLPDAAKAMGVPTISPNVVIKTHAKLGFKFKA